MQIIPLELLMSHHKTLKMAVQILLHSYSTINKVFSNNVEFYRYVIERTEDF